MNDPKYLDYLITFNDKVAILSTHISKLYGMESEQEFIQKVYEKLNFFPEGTIFFYENGNTAFNTKSPIAVFTERGIALLSSIFEGPEYTTINSEIIKAIIKMESLLETNALVKNDINSLSQENNHFLDEIQKKLKTMLQNDIDRTTKVFLNKYSKLELQKFGLT